MINSQIFLNLGLAGVTPPAVPQQAVGERPDVKAALDLKPGTRRALDLKPKIRSAKESS